MEQRSEQRSPGKARGAGRKGGRGSEIGCIALERILSLLFWILLWALAAHIMNKPLLVSTPSETFRTICRMLGEAAFWQTASATFLRMLGGFLLSAGLAFTLALLSAKLRLIRILAETPRAFTASVPLAAFVILALFWVGPEKLSFVISALVAFPILYSALLTGMTQDVSTLSEAGRMYRFGLLDRWRHIRWPALWPFLLSSAGVAMRMCWRSTVAAELITQVNHSIGGELYQAKIYLETAELFSWMVLLILFGNVSEAILKLLLSLVQPGGVFGRNVCNGAGSRNVPAENGKTEPTENQKPEPAESKAGPRIELSKVRALYRDGAAEYLVFPKEGLSLSAEGGSRIAVMGPSGAGKTTLLGVIAGGTEYLGERSVQGTCFMNFSEDRLAEHLSGRKNLLMCGFSGTDTEEMLQRLGLSEADGDRPVREYSKGMKRRLSLARALLGLRRDRGGILLLDEPFSGLDAVSRGKAEQEVVQVLDHLGTGAVLVLVTHETEEAEQLAAQKILRILPETSASTGA